MGSDAFQSLALCCERTCRLNHQVDKRHGFHRKPYRLFDSITDHTVKLCGMVTGQCKSIWKELLVGWPGSCHEIWLLGLIETSEAAEIVCFTADTCRALLLQQPAGSVADSGCTSPLVTTVSINKRPPQASRIVGESRFDVFAFLGGCDRSFGFWHFGNEPLQRKSFLYHPK
jgi:hypothetical protein